MKEKLKHELLLIYNTKTQSSNGKRLTCLDMARGIAILLVVIGHSGFVGPKCNIWISTFHLPTFFLLSGILLQQKEEYRKTLPQLLLYKARTILIPYFWFSLGSLCLDLLQILLGNFTWDVLLEHTIQTVTFQGYSVLWFLPVLYLAEIGLLCLYKLHARFAIPPIYINTIMTLLTTGCALGCYSFFQQLQGTMVPSFVLHTLRILFKALIAIAFMNYGCVFSSICSRVFRVTRKWGPFLFGALLTALNILAVPYVSLMDLNFLNLGNLWIYLLLGTTGGLGCLLLCITLPNIPLITFFGQNSLIIMCTHMNYYVMYFSMLFNLFLVPRLPGAGDTTYAVLSIAGTMFLSIPVIVGIHLFCPFVLGRNSNFKCLSRN